MILVRQLLLPIRVIVSKQFKSIIFLQENYSHATDSRHLPGSGCPSFTPKSNQAMLNLKRVPERNSIPYLTVHAIKDNREQREQTYSRIIEFLKMNKFLYTKKITYFEVDRKGLVDLFQPPYQNLIKGNNNNNYIIVYKRKRFRFIQSAHEETQVFDAGEKLQ